MTLRDTYTDTMKAQLDALDAQLQRVETRATEARADARVRYHEEMAKLREQSRLASVKFEDMRLAGEDSWEKTKSDMEKVRDAFVHSFRYFKSQL